MSNENNTLPRFRPERPIYLNTENTSLKTRAEVEHKVLQLRDQHWLCAVNDKSRPLHMSFNDPLEFPKFQKACEDLGFKLKFPKFSPDSDLENDDIEIVPEEPKHSFEDSKGRFHVEK